MRISAGAFITAIDYVSAFGGAMSKVQFSPQGKHVIVAVQGELAYGEYWLEPKEPLEQPFSVYLRKLPEIAKALEGDHVDIEVGSLVSFECGSGHWWLHTLPPNSVVRPDVRIEEILTWDHSFGPLLRVAAMTCGHGWDNVRITRKGRERAMSATDSSVLTVFMDEVEEMQKTEFLIGKELMKPLLAMTYGDRPIEFRIGVHAILAEVGKRKAILPISAGKSPKLDKVKKKLDEFRSGEFDQMSVSRADFVAVAHQADIVAGTAKIEANSRGTFLVPSGDDGSGRLQVRNAITCQGQWQSVKTQTRYLINLFGSWPDDRIMLESRGRLNPLVMTSGNLTSLIGPTY